MGTSLREVIEVLGGGALPDRRIVAVLPGASSAVVADARFERRAHARRVPQGRLYARLRRLLLHRRLVRSPRSRPRCAARFLAVESCGQCTPCKDDGLALTALLGGLIDGSAPEDAAAEIKDRLLTVTNEARCNLATQQQVVVGSLVARCGDLSVTRPVVPADIADAARRRLLVPLLDIVEGTAVFDAHEADKQPDWTFDAVDSGTYPAQRLQDVPASPA